MVENSSFNHHVRRIMNDTTASAPPPVLTNRFADWRYFDGVRTRRSLAFLVDCAIVLTLIVIAIPIIGILGFATLGAGWLLYTIIGPLVALSYIGWTMGSSKQATIGMRLNRIKLERYDGAPVDMITAIVHAVLFWAGNVILTPFIILVALFTRDKRMLHDIFLGTVVVRDDIDRS